MFWFQPDPLIGTMKASAAAITPGSVRTRSMAWFWTCCSDAGSIGGAAQVDADRDDAVLPEAGIHGDEVAQAASEEQRADDQHHRQRDLDDDERAAQREPLVRVGARASARLHRLGRVRAGRLERRAQTEQQAGERPRRAVTNA